MTKRQIEEIMKRNFILSCEVEDSINFVRDLLELEAEELEEKEPYAKNTINRLKEAAYEVFCLIDYIEEAEVL